MLPPLDPNERMEGVNVIWQALAWPGFEHLYIQELRDGGDHVIDGLLVGVFTDRPSRVCYRMELDNEWTFRSLNLTVTGEAAEFHDNPLHLDGKNLELIRLDDGRWDHNRVGQSVNLDGCGDIDIAVTPFTNTLPIRRLQLEVGASAEIDVVYVAVTDLTLSPARQRYSRIDESTYRFESLSSGFTAEISVDEHGLVTDYPGLFRRTWP